MMQVSKRIPFEDPQVLNTVRAVYIGSNVVIALIYAYIMSQINKKKGTSSSDDFNTVSAMSRDADFRTLLTSHQT